MSLGIIIAILFGWYLSRSRKEEHGQYRDLGNGKWITPDGFVDFNAPPELPLWAQFKNREADIEEEMEEWKYQTDLAWAEYEKQHEQYKLMKKDIDAMSPEEKLEYIPKWVEYLVEHRLEKKTPHNESFPPMSFEYFIAREICPYKFYGMKMIFRLPKMGRIRYVA